VLDDLTDEPRDVVVDLGPTEFVDCAGIGVLAVAHDRRRQLGGELVLESPSRAASKVLDLTGLADRIPTSA
jgi:anti-sigma B factor antagonist